MFAYAFIGVFAAGCSLLPPEYDNNEYELLARVEATARVINQRCDNTEYVRQKIHTLVDDAEVLYTYSFYIPRNTEVFQIAEILRDDARQIEKQYNEGQPSEIYCKLKTRAIVDKTMQALETIGNLPR